MMNTSWTLFDLATARSRNAGASSNRKSEITGIIEVLREKPVSVALRLPEFVQVLQAVAVLVGLEAVNHLALADARAHRAQRRESPRRR